MVSLIQFLKLENLVLFLGCVHVKKCYPDGRYCVSMSVLSTSEYPFSLANERISSVMVLYGKFINYVIWYVIHV